MFYPFLVLVEVVWVVGVIELDVFLAIATVDYFAVVAIRCISVSVRSVCRIVWLGGYSG